MPEDETGALRDRLEENTSQQLVSQKNRVILTNYLRAFPKVLKIKYLEAFPQVILHFSLSHLLYCSRAI